MQIVAHDLADPLAPFPPLFRDLVAGGPTAAALFSYDPRDPESFARRAAWLDGRERGRRPEAYPRRVLAEALTELNRRLGAAEPALEGAARLGEPGVLAVVAGQQPGLLGGPLYTLLKAVAAVRLARDLAAALDRPVVPVFWLASEDHDFEEAAQTWIVDRHGALRRFRLPPVAGRRSLGELPVPARAESLVRELSAALGDAGLAERLWEPARRSASLAEWCARLLAEWLSPHGLVLLDPMLRPLREAARGVFWAALVRREAIHRELAAAAARIRRRGTEPALVYGPEHAHLFTYHDGQRLALLWQGDAFSDRDGRLRLTVPELARRIQERPWLLSPDVVLRPVVQDWLLPTLAFVVGPGEAQYLAQLGGVYRLFGLEPPVIVPRLSLTLVPPAVAETLRRHGVGVGEFLADPDGPRRRVLQALDRDGLAEAVSRLRAAVLGAYEEAATVLQTLPAFAGVLAGNRARVGHQLDYLERKVWQHHRRRHRDAVRDLEAARQWLVPGGALQERTLAAIQFLAGDGGLVRALLRLPPRGGHQVAIILRDGSEEVADGGGLPAAGDRTASG